MEKARFAKLATASGLSESALAMIAIGKVLDPDAAPLRESVPVPARGPAATDRITIHLRPGDSVVDQQISCRDKWICLGG